MIRRIFRFIWKAVLWFFALSILSVIVFKWIPVPITPLMITRAVENKIDGKDMILSHEWKSLEHISVNLQKAVIASEDGNFLNHHGFDFDAMQKHTKATKKANDSKAEAPFRNKPQKTFFFGKAEVIFAKD